MSNYPALWFLVTAWLPTFQVPLVSITIGKTGGFAGFNEKWLGLYFTCGVVDPGFTPKSKSANGPKFILCSVR